MSSKKGFQRMVVQDYPVAHGLVKNAMVREAHSGTIYLPPEGYPKGLALILKFHGRPKFSQPYSKPLLVSHLQLWNPYPKGKPGS